MKPGALFILKPIGRSLRNFKVVIYLGTYNSEWFYLLRDGTLYKTSSNIEDWFWMETVEL